MRKLLLFLVVGLAGGALSACGDDVKIRRDAGFDGPLPTAGTGGSTTVDMAPPLGGGDGGMDTPSPVCSGSFVRPTMDAVLLPQDDADGDACGMATGFQYTVQIATAAADGTAVTLFAGANQIGQTTVMGSLATFTAVTLSAQGPVVLKAQIGGEACQITTMVSVNCMQPTCSIASPTISAMHPSLNGVPAPAGDRANNGADYQAAFEVTTNIEDGQPVVLEVASAATPTVITRVSATAMGGKATFAGVTLRPDGTYAVQAVCANKANVTGRSAKATIPVDTTPPALTVVAPTDGKHYNPTDLTDGKFSVCATTTSTDAVNVPMTVASMGNNLCAGIGTASPVCGKVTNGTTGMDCVALDCPGGAPFDVNVTLTDAAGNPTTKKITGVTCASSLPTVAIVSPLGDAAPFSDASKHILAANAPVGIKDLDANKTGAQANVVACTDRMGAKARLFAGPAGGTLAMVDAEVTVAAAVPSDNCPSGVGFVAKWSAVTLPESAEDDTGKVTTATSVRVDVTDLSNTSHSSPVVNVWVDSAPPALQPSLPNPLCGANFTMASGPYVTNVTVISTTANAVLKVTANAVTNTYDTPVFSANLARFANVAFEQGQSDVTLTSEEPSGNTNAFPTPCQVTVGNPPIVSITAPGPTVSALCASTTVGTCAPDADAATPGWQGVLTANVTVGGAPVTAGTVTFSTAAGDLGTATLDGAGNATLPNVTVPEGAAIAIKATTSDLGASGIGMNSRTFVVDVSPPPAVAAIAGAVKDRRNTSYRLSWTSPDDAGVAVTGYEVRVSRAAITEANFAMATSVTYSGAPAAPGGADGVDVTGLLIETPYFFAVRPIDRAGNVGPIDTTAPTPAKFNQTVLTRPAGGLAAEQFGYRADGSADLNGDGLSDLVVSTFLGNRAYIFFGTMTGYAATPSVTISGAASGYGGSSVVIGDIDGDGLVDIAVPAVTRGNGAVDIFKGRAVWPATLADSQADYVITAGAAYAGSGFANTVARIGDFDGDGVDDFAISASRFATNNGQIIIVRGAKPFASLDFGTPADLAKVITITGAAGAGRFGTSITGLGRFYPSPAGSTILVAAPRLGAGRVYAFAGQAAPGGTIDVATANATIDGVGTELLGFGLAPVGPIGSSPNVTAIDTSQAAAGRAVLGAGDATSGPFGRTISVTDSSGVTTFFGSLVFGGSFSGTNVGFSYIAGSEPDVIAVSGVGTTVRIVDGARIAAGLTGNADVNPTNPAGIGDVTITLPADWNQASGLNGAIRDSNGDGYADFAIGEIPAAGQGGRLMIAW